MCNFHSVVDAIKFSRQLDAAKSRAAQNGDEEKNLLGFGIYKNMSWQDIFLSKEEKHVIYVHNFILPKRDCFKGSAMFRFRECCKQQTPRSKVQPEAGRLKPKLQVMPNLSAAKGNFVI